MNKTLFAMLAVPIALIVGCSTSPPRCKDSLVARIRKDLPVGWQCTVINQDGKKGHPHGLQEPAMRIDFSSTGTSFRNVKGERPAELTPSIQLYLYDIADKPHLLEVIEKEKFYSWDIPICFGETEEYLVVTSPAYINHGVFTREAKQSLRPLRAVLRKHIENVADEL